MTNLDDLDIFSDLTSTDEALELIRQIRLGRRTIEPRTRTVAAKSKKTDVKVDANQAAELLKLLKGS